MGISAISATQTRATTAWVACPPRRAARLVACGLAACALLLIAAGPAHAVNYFPNSTGDQADTNPGNGVCLTAVATCTLRAAMQDAQALGSSPNTINLQGLPNPSTIDLGSALPTISGQTLAITGAGQDALTVRRVSGGDYSIFTTINSDVSISGMTITKGRAVAPGGIVQGGGIYSLFKSLTLDDVAVVDNAAATSAPNGFAEGGGIYKEQGTLTIRNSTISENRVDVTSSDGLGLGGGIAASSIADLDVVNSTISQNSVSVAGPSSVTARGGGIAVSANTIEIVGSTVRGNSAAAVGTDADFAAASGGGIEAFAGTFSMLTSTVDHNSASAANASASQLVLGGGIYVSGTPAVAVTSSTISANSASATPGGGDDTVAGGGIGILSGVLTISASTLAFNAAPLGANLSDAADQVRLRNTILSNPLGGGANCLEAVPASLVSDGYNLASDASCELDGTGDQPNTNPVLEALADNGGPTWTHALPLTSPAVDKGNGAMSGTHPALTTDQREKPRPFDQPSVVNTADGSDIGAFERQPQGYPAAVLANAPAGYWRFGELSGSTAFDSSGHGNNGTYINGPLLGQAGALAGDPNTAASFDGVNDQMRVPDANSLDVGDSFTLEGWVKRGAVNLSQTLFNKGANGLQLTVMSAGSGSQVWLRKAGVTTIAKSIAPVPADLSFHHVVVTKNGPSVVIYVDGVAGTTLLAPAQVIANTAFPLTFPDAGSTQNTFDEFALYDGVLTAADVTAHRTAAGL